MNKIQKSLIRESLYHRIDLTKENLVYFQMSRPDMVKEMSFPTYDFNELKPGVICQECHSFSTYVQAQTTFCRCCGEIEDAEETIKRHSEEFQMLFPDIPVTTSRIHNWCDGLYSKQRIYRVLRKNYHTIGRTKAAQYE
ncbi:MULTISPECIES: hypothetical protein [unclassified Jeotgalibaca]|uniref:hypothetical protein n=1 Tax=unclassified Jeotgalibaca TaxID=2621505 RepID=UPI003FCFCDDC